MPDHPRADSSLTDIEEQDTRDHLRELELDAAPSPLGVGTPPAGSPVDATRAPGTASPSGDRPSSVTGGLAQQAAAALKDAHRSHANAAGLLERHADDLPDARQLDGMLTAMEARALRDKSWSLARKLEREYGS